MKTSACGGIFDGITSPSCAFSFNPYFISSASYSGVYTGCVPMFSWGHQVYQDQPWKCFHCSGYNNEHNETDCPRCGGARY